MQPRRCYAARKPGYRIGIEKRRLAWLQLRRPVPVATLHSIARGNRCQREVSGVGTRCAAHHHTRIERSEEHTSELQSPCNLVCRLLLEKKKNNRSIISKYLS